MKTLLALHRARPPLFRVFTICALGLLLAGYPGQAQEQAQEAKWPSRVLLTNDNGIDDTGLIELARALDRVPGIEVIVAAATQDRSGTSNYAGATWADREYRVTRQELDPGIEAWAVDGYPADCVLFALSGPLRDRLPDVVVSGINGGPNLGDAWFGSGTIGAARTAAYFGIPAVAVSGLEDDDPAAVEFATSWVANFVQSGFVAALQAPEYLTVSLPVGDPTRIRGVRVVERARGLLSGESQPVERAEGQKEGGVKTWRLELRIAGLPAENTDVRAVQQGYIAIVPMHADESDADLMSRLSDLSHLIPSVQSAGAEPSSH